MNGKEFLQALENITKEKGIDKSIVLEAMEAALNAAYKKNFNSLTNSRVTIDEQTGEIKVFSYKTVVEKIENEKTEIDLEEAQKIIPNIQIGETIENEVTPKDFGRVAASTAKQVVVQKIKEAEKNSLMEEFEDKKDELMMGILSREDEHNYFVDLGRTHGILPKNETIPGEKLNGFTSSCLHFKSRLWTKRTIYSIIKNSLWFLKKTTRKRNTRIRRWHNYAIFSSKRCRH